MSTYAALTITSDVMLLKRALRQIQHSLLTSYIRFPIKENGDI